MVLVGAPILFMELSLGCALGTDNYLTAVSIAAASKLLGIFISFLISSFYLKDWVLQRFAHNIYLRALRGIAKKRPAKALTLLAIV